MTLDASMMSSSSSNASLDVVFGPAYAGGGARRFDFTVFFEDAILTIVPAALFLVVAGPRAVWLSRSSKKVEYSITRSAKLSLLSAFTTIQLAVLVTRATNLDVAAATSASIAAAALDFAAACALLVLSIYEHSRSVAPSNVIGVYLLASLVCDAVRLRTFYLLAARGVANLLSLSLALRLGVLVTEAVEKRGILVDPYDELPPETTSGIYSWSIFWWINPLLRVGFGKNLTIDDLFSLDPALATESLRERFQAAWGAKFRHGKYSLLLTTVGVLRWQLVLSALPRLLLSGAKFSQPFLVQATISFVSNKDADSSIGWGLVVGYFLCYFATAVLTAAFQHLLNRVCTQMRGGLISLLYQKTLDLSITASDPSASLTLMSSDIQRLVDAARLTHNFWSGVVELGIAVGLLYQQLGATCWAPATVYVVQLLGTAWVVRVITGFQKRWLNAVQARVSFTSGLLHSMRNVKLLGLSRVVRDQTQHVRDVEISQAKRFRAVHTLQIVMQNASGIFAPFVTFLVYYLVKRGEGESLDLASTFSVLTILRLVDEPLNSLIHSSFYLVASLSCFQRIQEYLLSPSRHDNRFPMEQNPDYGRGVPFESDKDDNGPCLVLDGCSFGWEQQGEAVVHDISLTVPRGSITMIIGPVGCGKSTLLKGMLSETPLSRGATYMRDEAVAFADQDPWVLNGSVRDAIYGASAIPADNAWYDEVVACCGLGEDIKQFPSGDMTVVGSKGISLSGGQKQRLALARAVFSRAETLMLDDVFSGLDKDTEELIFRRLFSRTGPLRRSGTTVILVTHAVHRLAYADLVVSLDAGGRVSEQGTYAALAAGDGYVHTLDLKLQKQRTGTNEEEEKREEKVAVHASDDETTTDGQSPPQAQAVGRAHEGVEDGAEQANDMLRRTGDMQSYKYWIQACGYGSTTLSFVWAIVWVLGIEMPGILVQVFSSRSSSDLAADAASFRLFIGIFAGSTTACALALVLFIVQIVLDMVPRCSRNMHRDLLQAVVDAPLAFFTTTDIGSVTNRFSQDLGLIDVELPFSYADTVLAGLMCVGGVGLMVASGSGWFALTVPVVGGVVWLVQRYYLRTSRQLRLLDLEAKAPLYTLFGETAAGLANVRAFGWAGRFAERHARLVDGSQRPFYLMYCIQRWLGVVLDLVVTGLVTVLMVVVVAERDSIDPGLVGLGLLAAVNLSVSLAYFVRFWTEIETSIGAITRVREFVRTTPAEHLPGEREDGVRDSWPERGEVAFEGFGAAYSSEQEAPLVLRGVDLAVGAGEKMGICGRSGSGKSSALASLLHVLEYKAGRIVVDGVDLAGVGREVLRGRVNVITQEPWWITTQSVRFNMDPWNAQAQGQDRDEQMVAALELCRVWSAVEAKGGLDATMGPDFLSHGQRQLFCLARALLRPWSRLVVLDEVSASVDVRTDEVMQGIIRERFGAATVLSVAHRLNTIEDCDRVVVLERGEVVEVGRPGELLGREGSRFRALREG